MISYFVCSLKLVIALKMSPGLMMEPFGAQLCVQWL